MTVVIVGAGLAGLVCARHLQKRNLEVMVLEADPEVGGRVRSDHIDGFILDRGFQVLFDQYPAVRRNLDLDALDLQPFEPGAIICQNGQRTVLTDPLRDRRWRDLLEASRSRSAGLADKLRTLRLALSSRNTDNDQRAEPDTQSTATYLREQGFSEQIIESFYRPFFGGVFLERDLITTEALFRFYFRMFSAGQTTLPAQGIGAMTQQLAAPLVMTNSVRTNSPVGGLLSDSGRVTGVLLTNGQQISADAVVLATDAPSAARLAPPEAKLHTPEGALGTTTLYFAGAEPLYHSRKIVLNANPNPLVNNAQMVSNVAPSYAPDGRHLLSVAVLGIPEMSDAQLVVAVMRDLRKMFAGNAQALRALATYYPLRIYRIPYAQFPQPPGIYRTLPSHGTMMQGLYIAAEYTDASSINGAMTSGERCAATVGQELKRRQLQ